MIKWLTKQFLYGRAFLWLKDKTEGLIFVTILIFLISYFHAEYLDYIEFKSKSPESNVGLSFIIKNTLIGIIAIGYMYFYFVIKKTKKAIFKKEEIKSSPNEMVTNLDEFLNEDELKK